MGICDNLYPSSAPDESISTHYVNLPHFARFKSKPAISADVQHDDFHECARDYASYLINEEIEYVKN